ncbi:hypothetical protein Pelo_6901 [Pelomyxa schiedti]|nr:hypothetical protein Pelo_6901 [Pelomyxa schiedti]
MLHCLQFGEERFWCLRYEYWLTDSSLVGVQEVYEKMWQSSNLLTHRPAVKISLFQQFQCCSHRFSNSNSVFQCSNFYITICPGASMKAHLTTMLLRAPFPKLWMNSEL